MSKPTDKNITWFQLNNIIPLIVYTAIVVSAFLGLNTKIELMDQKINFLVENTKTMKNEITQIQTEHKGLETRMTTLEVMHRK